MTRYLIPTLAAAMALTGCAVSHDAPEVIPTATPSAESASMPSPQPTPPATPPMALGLPDPSGIVVACESNALVLPLGDSFGAASRIVAQEEWLYVLIDGALYRIARAGADVGTPQIEPVIVREQDVAGRPVQELVDLAADPATSALLALDKVGHVYRYEPSTGGLTLVYRAAPNNGDPSWIEPQVVALAVGPEGDVLLLDTTHSALWQPDGLSALAAVGEAAEMEWGVDVAVVDDEIYVLGHDGSIGRIIRPSGMAAWRGAPAEPGLMLALRSSDHLGVPLLFVVDGLNRRIIGLDPATGESVTATRFAFPEMGLLRDADFAGGRLYAVADAMLIIFPGPETGDGCAPVDVYVAPWLYGEDPTGALADAAFPTPGGWLPPWSRLYPGANRLYRMGIHSGVDIYEYTAFPGFGVGSPVVAIADGQVIEESLDYEPVLSEEFDALVAESQALGVTPPEAMMRFYGRRVAIAHAGGVQTVYAHLSELAPEITLGAEVVRGQIIGAVGVSGTMGEDAPGTVVPHLHAEIWIGERYLGEGITLRETMWWFEQIFE